MKTAALAVAACSIAVSASAIAQSYASKPVRIIIPFAPAGPTDNQARWAAQQLTVALGQTVIADNRPGAGGVPGTEIVVKSPPDGYILLAGNPRTTWPGYAFVLTGVPVYFLWRHRETENGKR